jgi:hypothetical protein
MKSEVSSKFWSAYNDLPLAIQKIAVKQYRLWLKTPSHPSLQFKKAQTFWSCRVTDSYLALAVMDGDTAVWFWIGSHAEYELLIRSK